MAVAYFALLILIPVLVVLVVTIRLMRQHRFQFSLKTLMIVVTAFAVLLSVIITWSQWGKAQIEFLDPSSPIVSAWLAPPVITEGRGRMILGEGRFMANYRPKHRTISEILDLSEKTPCGNTSDPSRQAAELESTDRDALEVKLASMSKADVLQKGCFSIHGIIEDAAGNPVPYTTVDLLPWGFVNGHESRADGTFFLPIDDPTKMGYRQTTGYYLRIRYVGNSMDTTTFSLDSTKPELFVIVHVR